MSAREDNPSHSSPDGQPNHSSSFGLSLFLFLSTFIIYSTLSYNNTYRHNRSARYDHTTHIQVTAHLYTNTKYLVCRVIPPPIYGWLAHVLLE